MWALEWNKTYWASYHIILVWAWVSYIILFLGMGIFSYIIFLGMGILSYPISGHGNHIVSSSSWSSTIFNTNVCESKSTYATKFRWVLLIEIARSLFYLFFNFMSNLNADQQRLKYPLRHMISYNKVNTKSKTQKNDEISLSVILLFM